MTDTVLPGSTWEENPSTSGSFHRPLDELEGFFATLTNSNPGNEHWAISVNLHLSFPKRLSSSDIEEHLKRAWLAVAHHHSALVSSMKTEPSHETIVIAPLTNREDDDSWLRKTFFTQLESSTLHEDIDTETSISDRLFASLRNTTVPTCHWIPASQELHLRSQHWRVDGIGMLMLANSFMLALASAVGSSNGGAPPSIPEPSNNAGNIGLTPCLYDISNSNLDEDATPQHYKDAADSLINTFLRGFPSIGLPTNPGSEDVAPRETGRTMITFSVVQTEGVVAACKARAISVSSAVHAAIVRAAAKYPQHPLAKDYTSFFPTNMRQHLPDSVDGSKLIVNVICVGLPVHVSGALPADGSTGKSFDTIAAEISAVYASDLARPRKDHAKPNVTMLKLAPPLLRREIKLLTSPLPPDLPPVQTPDLSSLGKVEENYIKRVYPCGTQIQDEIEVLDIWLGTQMMNRQLQCHVWTFRDQLRIQGCYNLSFYGRGFINDFFGVVQNELLLGLGVI